MNEEKWEVLIHLTPSSNPDDRDVLRYEYASQEEAIDFAKSAAVSANCQTEPGGMVAIFYPAHRVSLVVARRIFR